MEGGEAAQDYELRVCLKFHEKAGCKSPKMSVTLDMIADRIAQIFNELETIETEISKAPPQGKGEKKAQAVNLGRIQAIRDILYELKGSAVVGEIVRRVKSENN